MADIPETKAPGDEHVTAEKLGAKDDLCAEPRALSIFRSQGSDPFENLAIEAALAGAMRPQELIVFLWQNDHTIVIGRNQNAWRECPVDEFEAAGGHVARRRSGGGAVYHDLGNLNVSFLALTSGLDEDKNIASLVGAVRSFGIDAASTGRNDLTIDGVKFSGTAKWTHRGVSCQHATLMVDVDIDEMSRWLHPDKRKLVAKGVTSVRSRVRNLSQLADNLTIDTLVDAVVASCEHVFGLEAVSLDAQRLDASSIAEGSKHFASREWRLGASRPFEHHFGRRFDWGSVDVELDVKRGIIVDARVYSDAMDAELAPALASAMRGCAYDPLAVAAVLEHTSKNVDESQAARWIDVAALALGAVGW